MMLIWHTVLILSNFLSVSIAFSPRDINSEIYDITIGNTPHKLSEVHGEHIEIFSKHGQQFSCLIPEFIPKFVNSEPLTNMTVEELNHVLTKLNKSDCLILRNGWWTYKVCIGKVITQYHEQNDHQSDEIILGKYSSEYQWSNAEIEHDEVKYKYHSQFYTNGAICEVTGSPRAVQLRLICQEHIDFPAIIEVTEPEMCNYVIKIAAFELCNVSSLAPQKSIIPNSISCSPSLSDEAFSKYVTAKEYKNKQAKLAKVEANFYKLLPKLHTLRLAAIDNRLNRIRSHRKRQLKQKIRYAHKFSRHSVALLRLIESNFEHVKMLPAYQMLAIENYASFPTIPIQSPKEVSKPYDLRAAAELFKKYSNLKTSLKDTILSGKSKKQNSIILNIASNLIVRIRTAFELYVSNRVTPRTVHMLLGATNILQNLTSSKELLPTTEAAILKDEPRWRLHTLTSKEAENFAIYEANGSLLEERSVLKTLNISIILSQHNLQLIQVHDVLLSVLTSQFPDYVMAFQDLEDVVKENGIKEVMDEGEQPVEEASKETVGPVPGTGPEGHKAITDALNSLTIIDKLATLNRISSKPLRLKTAIKQMNDGVAFLITIVNKDEAKNKFDENQANYQFTITDE